MSPADRDALNDTLDDLGRARALAALVRWAISHSDPPEREAWGGLYVVACDAERAIEEAEKTARDGLNRAPRCGLGAAT